MDIEKQRRAELIGELEADFYCFEECDLRHGLFPDIRQRADVVAVSKEEAFQRYLLAFEVKEPATAWNYARWNQAIRQAADYVYSDAGLCPCSELLRGGRVAGSFLFPAPPYDPLGRRPSGPYIRESEVLNIAGAFHLALHFRVGHAFREQTRFGPRFVLAFGPNEVWRSGSGFTGQAEGLLGGSRTIGSRKIDVFREINERARAALLT